jgi:two-component system capsular synthesis sensor histidine kinase RcsC
MLRLAGKRSYDVILTDVRPGGLEKVLGNQPQTEKSSRPLVIALTDPAKPGFDDSCLDAGMDHCISKPVDQRELRLQLKACSLLTGNCRIRPAS